MRTMRWLALAAWAWMALPSAQPIAEPPQAAFGEKREILLNQKGKQEEVTVEVERTGYLVVRFDKVPTSLYPEAAFWQGESKLQYIQKNPVFRAQPGRYQVKVLDRFNAASDKPFTFWIEFVPEEDPSEPNGQISQARPVKLGEPITSWLLPPGDEDLFRFELEKPGYLRVKLKSPASNLYAKVQLLNASGKPESAEGETLTEKLPAGAHYAKLFSKFSGWSGQPVSLEFSLMEELDPSEPNDTPAAARKVDWDELVPFWILPAGDRDLFRFEAPEAGYAWLTVSPHPGMDLALTPEWLDEEGKVLTSGRWVQRVPKGSGLLRLKSRYEALGEESVKPLYASLSLMPETDSSEPNDTLETARAIELNSVVKFQLIPEEDVDFFRFELKEPSLVISRFVMAPAGPSSGAYTLEFLDAQGKPVESIYRWEQTSYISLDAGTYFTKVQQFGEGHTGFEWVGLLLAKMDFKVSMEGIDFTLIGLGVENDPATRKQLQLIAQANSGKLVLTSETAALKEEFVKAARKAEPGRGLGWLWLLAAGAALLLFLAKRKKP
ncbi:MAG: hypothetical protein HYS41_00905 [Candidatus Omnitrophica bacterium]|nr:hypothetical protein [Candidatus Omnitrophota bacterium]